jgi:hypothetical protein
MGGEHDPLFLQVKQACESVLERGARRDHRRGDQRKLHPRLRLFVNNGSAIGEYDATTGAAINANFITGLSNVSDIAFVNSMPEPSSLVLIGIAAASIGVVIGCGSGRSCVSERRCFWSSAVPIIQQNHSNRQIVIRGDCSGNFNSRRSPPYASVQKFAGRHYVAGLGFGQQRCDHFPHVSLADGIEQR